jgi:hypothetical protein
MENMYLSTENIDTSVPVLSMPDVAPKGNRNWERFYPYRQKIQFLALELSVSSITGDWNDTFSSLQA